jgi:cysteine sulfinate desulfinase/cysteine desulfurase-like protein
MPRRGRSYCKLDAVSGLAVGGELAAMQQMVTKFELQSDASTRPISDEILHSQSESLSLAEEKASGTVAMPIGAQQGQISFTIGHSEGCSAGAQT